MIKPGEQFSKLKTITDKLGSVYGTEDFCIYLYSLVKMTKAQTVLELGTGLGLSMLWIAQALQENKSGMLHTIDDGSEWDKIRVSNTIPLLYEHETYKSFIHSLIQDFSFDQEINFYNDHIKAPLDVKQPIDILFADFNHGPYSVLKILADYLPLMSDHSYMFIDSASTYYSSYHTLEALVSILNSGRLPQTFQELIDPHQIKVTENKVRASKFELSHIIETKNRNQNSTAQIKIVPLDIMPQPRVNIRF